MLLVWNYRFRYRTAGFNQAPGWDVVCAVACVCACVVRWVRVVSRSLVCLGGLAALVLLLAAVATLHHGYESEEEKEKESES
jgi:hypothetical protein